MRGVNKVILIGNLGGDPEIRYTQAGDAVATLSVATSEQWIDKRTGDKQERTEWHRVVIFGKIAEIAQQYLRKGSKIYVEGKLRTRKWQGQDGADRYTTEVVIGMGDTFQMLDSKPQEGQSARPASPQGQGQGQARNGRSGDSAASGGQEPPPFDDDIPF